MCLYPRILKNKKYTSTKKNGGIIPAVLDSRVIYVPIGCGKCMECRRKKAREWQVRLMEDIKVNTNGKFVTLTFSNESIKALSKECEGAEGYELDNGIAKKGVRRWLENWRSKYKKSLRHWLVTELGGNGTENIHIHGIIWTDKEEEEIKEKWNYGHVWMGGYVNEKTVNYIVKYVNKIDEKHKYYQSKILTSAGIGGNYMQRKDVERNKYKINETNEGYKTTSGHEIAMPIYWRNKIYNESEREALWIEKLNKEERWVGGEKISVKDGEKEYFKVLEWYRIKNKRLGYGDNEIDWNKKKYENELRKIKIKERIIKSK